MKIEKGYTLSQFVEIIKNRSYQKFLKFHNDYNDFAITNLGLIYRYNELLDQPLTKDMFVNNIERPNIYAYTYPHHKSSLYHQDLKEYEEAEKKVIFYPNEIIKLHKGIAAMYNDFEIYIFDNGACKYNYHTIKTIGDIFQSTNGELKTKNITI